VRRDTASDLALVQAIEVALTDSQASIDHFFFDWAGGSARRGEYGAVAFDPLRAALKGYTSRLDLTHAYWTNAAPCTMLIEDVEAIWKPIAETDDWTLLNAKVTAIRQMGDALANRRPAA
jgi:serine/tyrosine/threonine adenylyltransferase